MKVTKVYAHISSFSRKENEFILTITTECNYAVDDKICQSNHTLEISFETNSNSMSPVGEYEQSCMALLEEFSDVSILQEEDDRIREAYFIGKLIDEISFDLLVKTKLTKYYEGTFELVNQNLN